MGNPAIAIPALNAIHSSRHDLAGVVSNGPKAMGRGRSIRHTAIGNLAMGLGLNFIPVYSLQDETFQAKLISYSPDIFVVVAFRILPKSILEIPSMGSVNLHTSLLPKYRGAAPIQRALLNGDSETGITTFLIKQKVDTGAILMQEKVQIEKDDDLGTLSEKMAVLGADLVLETLNQLEKGSIDPVQQDDDLASPAPKINKEMCVINWADSAEKIHNQIRALSPFPGAFTTMNGRRLKIFKSLILTEKYLDEDGKISLLEKNRMAISCGEGELEIIEIQLANKSRMSMEACLQGVQFNLGDTIGE